MSQASKMVFYSQTWATPWPILVWGTPSPSCGVKIVHGPPQLAAAPLFSAVKIAFCSVFEAIFYASLGAFSGLEISTCGGVGTRRTETRAFIGQMFARYITIGGLYRAYVGL